MSTAVESRRLELEGISVAYRGVPALQDVDLTLGKREILGVIGPNGAGKTTLINVVSGYAKPDAGWVRLDGKDVTGRAPERLARAGVGRTFQSVRLFGRLSVRENVEVAALAAGERSKTARTKAAELLEQFELAGRADVPASSLPYGDERRLSLARSLAAAPAFLLLDEPAAGLDEVETARLAATIATLPDRYGCGVLVVEHDVGLILGLCHRVQVLAHGRTIAVGPPDDVRVDPMVIESYLGRRGAQHARG
jgi:branched-chain amino acid transport system ATP-binding protein